MTTENEPGVATEETEQGEYGLHIRLAREMQPVLRDAADLAYKMEDIAKPDLVDLINLFIGWGLSIQKKKWLVGWDIDKLRLLSAVTGYLSFN